MFATTYGGLRVLDLSTNIAGPFAAMLFGDMGADVIKVERAPGGDDTRHLPPFWEDSSTVFLSVNRNKRGLLLDFREAEHLATLRRLIASADVVIESFPPGVAHKLGLEFSDLTACRPDVILCSISAFGDGPEGRSRPGYDALVQAYSGLLSFTGEEGGPPVRIAPSVLDISTGMWAAMAIMAALRERDTNSAPQHLRPCLVDSAFVLMCHQVAAYFATGENPARLGSGAPSAVPYRIFAGSDGHFMLATASDAQFVRLCAALDKAELAADARFADMAARIQNRQLLDALLQEVFLPGSVAHWLALLGEHRISVGPVHSVDEAVHTALVRERALFFDPAAQDWPQGLPLVRSPFDAELAGWSRPPPKLGEHNHEILAELDASGLAAES